MPELPEVETVRKCLQMFLVGSKPKTIKSIKAYYPNIIKGMEPHLFIKTLIGQSYTSIDRYGKHLILKFNTVSIISHLRMEGKYLFGDENFRSEKHDHVQFMFTDNTSLIYNDVRKFGTMHLVKKGEEMFHISLSKLGPQVNNFQTFTCEYLTEKLQKNNKLIKELLLDQTLVCGIGNIYVDQILFAAGVHPETKGRNIKLPKIKQIVQKGRIIIDKAIVNNGTTFRSFSSNHQAGSNQFNLCVYAKEGQPCPICGSAIKKIKVAGRGTHFCYNCQK